MEITESEAEQLFEKAKAAAMDLFACRSEKPSVMAEWLHTLIDEINTLIDALPSDEETE